MAVSPARRVAYEVLLRVFEQDAYADRVVPQRRARPRRARARVRAAARLRRGAARADARPRDRARSASGRSASSTRRSARRCGSARTSSATPTPRRTPPRTSRSSSCGARGSSAPCRSRTRSCAGSPEGIAAAARRAARRRRSRSRIPTGSTRRSSATSGDDERARADAGDERAARDRRAARPRRPAAGEPTDIPGAYRVERVDELAVAEGRIWPQSRGSQLAGLVVGSQEGERVLDLCAAPGGKTTQLRGEVTAVEIDPNRASELRANLATLRRDERHGRRSGRHAASRRSSPASTARSSTRPARASASSAQRPDLRWRAEPLPELQLALLRAAAERVKPGGTIVYSVCTINADENEAVVEASGLDVAAARRRVAALRASDAPRVPAHAAACPRHERVLHQPTCASKLAGRRGLARLDPDGRDRTVALRGGLSRPRRAGRHAASRRRARLPLRRRRRPLRRADHDRADRAPGVAPLRARVDGGRDRLPPDGRQPRAPLPADRRAPAATASRSTTRRSRTSARRSRRAREHGLEVGVAFNPETEPEDVAKARRRRGPRALHEHPPGLLGPGVHAGGARADRAASRGAARPVRIQVDGGIDAENIRSVYDAGATLIVAGSAIFAREDLPRAYRRSSRPLPDIQDTLGAMSDTSRGRARSRTSPTSTDEVDEAKRPPAPSRRRRRHGTTSRAGARASPVTTTGELDVPDDVDVLEGEPRGTRRGVGIVVSRVERRGREPAARVRARRARARGRRAATQIL